MKCFYWQIYEAMNAVSIKITVAWDMTSYSFVGWNRRLEGTVYLPFLLTYTLILFLLVD
jgi:hypothetical protein